MQVTMGNAKAMGKLYRAEQLIEVGPQLRKVAAGRKVPGPGYIPAFDKSGVRDRLYRKGTNDIRVNETSCSFDCGAELFEHIRWQCRRVNLEQDSFPLVCVKDQPVLDMFAHADPRKKRVLPSEVQSFSELKRHKVIGVPEKALILRENRFLQRRYP